LAPRSLEVAAKLAATAGDHRIGADYPEHLGLLEAAADESLAARLRDTGAELRLVPIPVHPDIGLLLCRAADIAYIVWGCIGFFAEFLT